MSKFKRVLMFVALVIGVCLVEGFTNNLGALLVAGAFGYACYHDGLKDGRRNLLIDKARFWWK